MNNPNHEINFRAVAEVPADKLPEALEYYRKAVAARPNDAEVNFLYGVLLHRSGNNKEARAKLANAVSIAPKHAGYRVALAEQYASLKMWDNAMAEMRIATSLAPADWRVWLGLGDIAGAADRLVNSQSAYQRALELDPRNLTVAMKTALAAARLRQFAEARKILEGIARTTQVNAAFTALYTDVLEAQGDWATLGEVARLWSEQQPNHPRAWETRARAALETGWLHAAIDMYAQAMALSGPNADSLASLAQLCMNALEFDRAEQALNQAEQLDAANVNMLSAKAGLLMFLGRLDEAEQYCQRSLDRDPKNILAYRLLSQLKRGHLAPDQVQIVAACANDPTQNIHPRIFAAFVLGDSLDAADNIDGAMATYELAHQLAIERNRAELLSYDPQAREREVDQLIAHFASMPESISKPSSAVGVDGAAVRPIFIVGMPRSGTTIIESILGSHSRVLPCGERVAMRQIMREYLALSETAGGVQPQALMHFAQAYSAGLPALYGADHFTDKNPWNFDAIGLILKLLPHARIVHIRRNPIETGLSVYRNQFAKFQTFADRLEHIGHYYGQYARLMAHWESLADDRIITIQYESFVADYERNAPALVAACGLAWEESCRNFQTSRRVIPTLSAVQARSPVVDHSGRAQRYERHLSPLIDALVAASIDLQTGKLAQTAT